MSNLAFKTKESNEMQIAFSALNLPLPVNYHIEEVTDSAELIEVVFIDKSKLSSVDESESWIEGRILKNNLRKYVYKNGLNRFMYDSSDNEGNHIQQTAEMPIDAYINEFLSETVASYLNAGKTFITYSSAIEELYAN